MNMPAQPTCTCMLSLHTVPESYSYSYLVLTPYLWITHPLVASGQRGGNRGGYIVGANACVGEVLLVGPFACIVIDE